MLRKSVRLSQKAFRSDLKGKEGSQLEPVGLLDTDKECPMTIFSDVTASVSVKLLKVLVQPSFLRSVSKACHLILSCDDNLSYARFSGQLEQLIKAQDIIARNLKETLKKRSSSMSQNYLDSELVPTTYQVVKSEPDQATHTLPVPDQATWTLPVPDQATRALPVPDQATRALPVPDQATQTLSVPDLATQTLPVPDQATWTLPVPDQATRTLPVLDQATQTLPDPDQATQTLPVPDLATQTLPVPDLATQTLPVPDQAIQTLPVPDQATQTLPVPDQATQTLPVPDQATQTLPVPLMERKDDSDLHSLNVDELSRCVEKTNKRKLTCDCGTRIKQMKPMCDQNDEGKETPHMEKFVKMCHNRTSFTGINSCEKSTPVECTTNEKISTPDFTTSKKISTPDFTTSKKISTPDFTTSKKISTPECTPNEKISRPECATDEKISTPECTPNKKISTPECTPNKNISTPECTTNEKISRPECATDEKISRSECATDEKLSKPECATDEPVFPGPASDMPFHHSSGTSGDTAGSFTGISIEDCKYIPESDFDLSNLTNPSNFSINHKSETAGQLGVYLVVKSLDQEEVVLEDATALGREEVVVSSACDDVYHHVTPTACLEPSACVDIKPAQEISSLDFLALLGEVAEQSQLNSMKVEGTDGIGVQDGVKKEGPDMLTDGVVHNKSLIPTQRIRSHKRRQGKVLDEKGRWMIPCSLCSFMARKPHMLRTHMQLHKQGKKTFKCRHCSFSALQGNLVAQHEVHMHSDLIYACEECAYRTDSLERMKRHSRIKHRITGHGEGATNSPVIFQCPICEFRSTIENCYMKHVEIHRAPEGANKGDGTLGLVSIFKCLRCTYETEKKKLFLRHMNNVHQCAMCGSIFTQQQDLVEHRRSHTPHDRLQCHLCGLHFNIRKKLDLHMRFHTGEYPHVCHCGQPFTSEVTLKKHIQAVHESSRNFPCELCGKSFTTCEYYKYHVEKVHREKSEVEAAAGGATVNLYRCEHCHYLTPSHPLLLQHTRQQHRDLDTLKRGSIYECTICGFKTLHATGYQRHLASHREQEVVTILERPASSFKCGLCEFRTTHECLYEEHMTSTHKCTMCKQVFISSQELNVHRSTCSAEKCLAICATCNQVFITQEDLAVHLKETPGHSLKNKRGRPRVHPVPTQEVTKVPRPVQQKPVGADCERGQLHNMLQCNHCEADFHSHSALKEHLKTHEEKPTFICDACGAFFRLKETLQKHLYHNHKLANRFQCVPCGRQFKRKENLNSHIRTQHGEEATKKLDRSSFPYACKTCGKKFKTKIAERQHQTVHADFSGVICDICDATYKSQRSCYLHKLRVHVKQFKCKQCSSKFTVKERLDRHMIAKHPTQTDVMNSLQENELNQV